MPPDNSTNPNKLVIETAKACILVNHLRRHHLSLRELLIAELIVDISYGWGLRAVRIPVLEDFTDLCGIDRPNVHRTLQALEEVHIITRSELDGMIRYEIQPDPEMWKVRVRVFPATVRRAEEKLRALNSIYSHLEAEALPVEKCPGCPGNFQDCPGSKFFGCGVASPATVDFKKQGGAA